jgi:hypothetical protein
MSEVKEVRYQEVQGPAQRSGWQCLRHSGSRSTRADAVRSVEGEVERFVREATADDYDHLIATAMKWVAIY